MKRTKRTKSRKSRRGRRHRQRGGQAEPLVPSGYADTVVSYTPRSDEIGDPDMVPRISSADIFKADSEAAT
jgi:hypothetical protein